MLTLINIHRLFVAFLILVILSPILTFLLRGGKDVVKRLHAMLVAGTGILQKDAGFSGSEKASQHCATGYFCNSMVSPAPDTQVVKSLALRIGAPLRRWTRRHVARLRIVGIDTAKQ